MKIVIEAIINSIASKVDGSVSVKIETQELDSSKAGELFQLRGKFVKVLISDSNISTLEAELVDSTKLASGKKNKSKSQRLRNILYIYCKLLNEGDDFEKFYDDKMDLLISQIKMKVDDLQNV